MKIITIEQYMEMLALQKDINDSTASMSWVHGLTNKGRSVNWPRCIFGESFELMDSFPWKHWKDLDGVADMANARKELVDIWHFLLSYGIHAHFMFGLFIAKKDLLHMASSKSRSSDPMENDVSTFNEEIYSSLVSLSGYKSLLETGTVSDEDEYDSFYYSCVEGILSEKIFRAMTVTPSKPEGDIYAELDVLNMIATRASVFESKAPTEGTEYMHYSTKIQMFDSMLLVFNKLLTHYLPMDLPREYLGKNVLNRFRQENGYKEGSYIKMWDGIEDNVHLDVVLANIADEDLNICNIYSQLEDRYKEYAITKNPTKG